MFFIGVITNQKNEIYIREKLKKIIPIENIIFITEKNIFNIKNIKFETIIIDSKLNNIKELRKIISNAKYIILNADIQMDFDIINNLQLNIITYGFNNKSTFTVSSIEENDIIICLQRIIINKKRIKIEPQEYQLKSTENTDKYATIATSIIEILYN